eukprot:CAMPEP_0196741910 /NCGR_PEP_ID=MMETSP1091-20130531/43543_1 /TAXON_ID=302021 /ORGANISM="Rhodomonas sp., Strain CCMP768" /LENGTH=336 /DNA_ID=CAMNT_0042087789 /DNA_START=28 /DNA_END=1038 /DNA_ORIENTATION=+
MEPDRSKQRRDVAPSTSQKAFDSFELPSSQSPGVVIEHDCEARWKTATGETGHENRVRLKAAETQIDAIIQDVLHKNRQLSRDLKRCRGEDAVRGISRGCAETEKEVQHLAQQNTARVMGPLLTELQEAHDRPFTRLSGHNEKKQRKRSRRSQQNDADSRENLLFEVSMDEHHLGSRETNSPEHKTPALPGFESANPSHAIEDLQPSSSEQSALHESVAWTSSSNSVSVSESFMTSASKRAGNSTQRDRSPPSPSSAMPKLRKWTEEEHILFLQGLERFRDDSAPTIGRAGLGHGTADLIAALVKTKTPQQVRSHAQKHFERQTRERAAAEAEGKK